MCLYVRYLEILFFLKKRKCFKVMKYIFIIILMELSFLMYLIIKWFFFDYWLFLYEKLVFIVIG